MSKLNQTNTTVAGLWAGFYSTCGSYVWFLSSIVSGPLSHRTFCNLIPSHPPELFVWINGKTTQRRWSTFSLILQVSGFASPNQVTCQLRLILLTNPFYACGAPWKASHITGCRGRVLMSFRGPDWHANQLQRKAITTEMVSRSKTFQTRWNPHIRIDFEPVPPETKPQTNTTVSGPVLSILSQNTAINEMMNPIRKGVASMKMMDVHENLQASPPPELYRVHPQESVHTITRRHGIMWIRQSNLSNAQRMLEVQINYRCQEIQKEAMGLNHRCSKRTCAQ